MIVKRIVWRLWASIKMRSTNPLKKILWSCGQNTTTVKLCFTTEFFGGFRNFRLKRLNRPCFVPLHPGVVIEEPLRSPTPSFRSSPDMARMELHGATSGGLFLWKEIRSTTYLTVSCVPGC